MTLTLKKTTLTPKMGGSVHLPQRGHVLLAMAVLLGLGSSYLGSYRELSSNVLMTASVEKKCSTLFELILKGHQENQTDL